MHKGSELLNKQLQYLKGVGEARAALFRRLGVHTVGDVISHYPRDYEDRSRLKKIIQLQDGDQCSFEGIIASRVVVSKPRKGLAISKVSIRDDTGLINAVWFNKPYLKDQLKPGERYLFFGKVTRRGTFEVLNPVYEKSDESGPVPATALKTFCPGGSGNGIIWQALSIRSATSTFPKVTKPF